MTAADPVVPAGSATPCAVEAHSWLFDGTDWLCTKCGVNQNTMPYWAALHPEAGPAVGAGPDTPTETRKPLTLGDVLEWAATPAVPGEPTETRDVIHVDITGQVDPWIGPPEQTAPPEVPGEPVPALPGTVDVRPRSVDQVITENFNLTREVARLRAALAARPALPDDTEALRKVILASLKRTVANDDAEYGVPLRLLLVMAKDASAALAAVPLGPEPTALVQIPDDEYEIWDGPEPTTEGTPT